MPIRGLLYFSSLYQNYIKERGYNLYGSKRILLPFPNYLVFYNRDSRKPDRMELLLSDCFQKAGQEMPPGLECRVRLLNINHGHNREMMEKCQRLKKYADFVGEVKKNLQEGMELEGAVTAAMDDCMSRGILTDILNRCRAEVLHMLLAEYDEKKTMDYIRRESREIGEKIGERRGLKKGQKIGGQKAAKRINKLNYLLLSENRYEDLKHASADAKYQRKLFKDYGI